MKRLGSLNSDTSRDLGEKMAFQDQALPHNSDALILSMVPWNANHDKSGKSASDDENVSLPAKRAPRTCFSQKEATFRALFSGHCFQGIVFRALFSGIVATSQSFSGAGA